MNVSFSIPEIRTGKSLDLSNGGAEIVLSALNIDRDTIQPAGLNAAELLSLIERFQYHKELHQCRVDVDALLKPRGLDMSVFNELRCIALEAMALGLNVEVF